MMERAPESDEEAKLPSTSLLVSEVPPETPEQFATFLARQQGLFGALFSNTQQFEVFAMLPLNDNQKRELAMRLMREIEDKEKRLVAEGPPQCDKHKKRQLRSPDEL